MEKCKKPLYMKLLLYHQKLKNYKITKNKMWKNSSKQPQDPIKDKINYQKNIGFKGIL